MPTARGRLKAISFPCKPSEETTVSAKTLVLWNPNQNNCTCHTLTPVYRNCETVTNVYCHSVDGTIAPYQELFISFMKSYCGSLADRYRRKFILESIASSYFNFLKMKIRSCHVGTEFSWDVLWFCVSFNWHQKITKDLKKILWTTICQQTEQPKWNGKFLEKIWLISWLRFDL